jgi:hypothetical protein
MRYVNASDATESQQKELRSPQISLTRARFCPDLSVPVRDGSNPLKSKGVDEPGLCGSGAAHVQAHRGRVLAPIRNVSTACAAWRPSRIAQTTSDWPRRMSPAVKTLASEVL